tara:strand:- start:26462 stop:31966 length:5505 start_codon:yes stop_codon:yes gene_type:complete
MAEKRFIKGLFKDTGHIDQPEGSWRHARNMVINATDGAVSNEGGTQLLGHLGENPNVGSQNDKVVGTIEVNDNRTVFFVTDVVSALGRSEIGMYEDGIYTILFNPNIATRPTNDLDFRESHPIEGTFKVDAKGDLIVYWTDDLNPPRAFNVDRQLREMVIGFSDLYGIPSAQIENIDILNLFPYSGPVPHIYVGDQYWGPPFFQDVVKEGGGLLTGVYYLALAYVDNDLVATNYLTVSNPISIVEEYDHTRPTTKKDGAKEGSQTAKSIKWRVTNLNTNYKFIRPVIIRKMGEAVDAFKLSDLEIKLNLAPTPFQEITFSGLETKSTGSVEEVLIDTIAYDTAKTIQQLDNVLYLGNTSRSIDLGYQKHANNIKSRSFVKKIEDFDEIWATADGLQSGYAQSKVDEGNYVEDSKSYRYIPNITNYRGYMRDEVYAFYIAFIMNDGSMSYAYHIPGREHINSNYSGYDINGILDETDVIPTTTEASKALKDLSDDARLYHFYDRSWVNVGANSHPSGSRHMQFWNNVTETYPNTSNFDVYDGAVSIGSLKGKKVRHHKMPSNANYERTTVESDFNTNIIPSATDPTPVLANIYTGSFQVKLTNGSYAYTGVSCLPDAEGNQFLPNAWTAVNMTQVFNDAPTNGVSATSTVYSGNTFTAQSTCTVTCQMHVQWLNDDACSPRTADGRFKVVGGSTGPTESLLIQPARCGVCASPLSYGPTYASQMGAGFLNPIGPGAAQMTGTWTTTLTAGQQLKFYGDGYESNSGSKKITPLCHDKSQSCGVWGHWGPFTTNSWVKYTVTYGAAEDYHDANIKHDVNLLGMHFDDIKIPAAYRDKIQGFRIFRADRKHSNKTVLGQSHVIPMKQEFGVLGLCKEATTPSQLAFAAQVQSGLGLEAELFQSLGAWTKGGGQYVPATGPSSQRFNFGYKFIQFYDFGLLRKKNSLSPATHLQVQYRTDDLVWNGPEINQPKKMITVLSAGAVPATDPYKIKEVWGYDNEAASGSAGKFQNCYERAVNSALFVGGKYKRAYSVFTGNNFNVNRVLGQKAKSYIQGDTIFRAASLGFGGKLVNLGGNSSIVLGIADKLELPAIYSQQAITQPAEFFGVYNPGFGFNLVTRDEAQVTGDASLPVTHLNRNPRHQNYIVNLNSFKTDVYKNIDNQELVWTGWEVVGDDIDNFLYNDGSAFSPSVPGTFSTETVTPIGASCPGIFGGDTFIARYGAAEAYSPSDDQTLATPESSIHSYIIESTDNIALRHAESDDSLYYPGSIAKDVLSVSGRDSDLNHIDNLKYNDNYSANNDMRTAFPLPLRDVLQNDFPTRTHRSAKNDTTSIIDNYRIFLANQFKDLPKNRGELWKLSSFNNLLYFHMQESLFAAQGKQTMSMKDGSEAFVGSGDIFAQEPNELIQAEGGFGGTQSQYATLTTRYGYFFVDQKAGKVFMMKESLDEISKLGMRSWFKDNLPFVLSPYGVSDDNPLQRFGLHATYDSKYKRVLLTKREIRPTQAFLTALEAFYVPFGTGGSFLNIRYNPNTNTYQQASIFGGWNNIGWNNATYFDQVVTGWTISYYPEMGVWGGFHDYVPYHYFKDSNNFYSLTDQYPRPVVFATSGTTFGNAGIWKHNHTGRDTTFFIGDGYGVLYQENQVHTVTDNVWISTLINHYPFEFEFIHNEYKGEDTLVSAFNYTLETHNGNNISVLEHGFTQYFLYNTFQISGIQDLEYLINTRRIGNNWKINKFRDMAALVNQTGVLGLPNTSPYYMSPNTNVTGGVNTGTVTSSSINNMFIYDGMSKTLNAAYLDLAKNWNLQRKFIDKWVGIRLIYNNISNNSLNLYSTDVVVRKMHR